VCSGTGRSLEPVFEPRARPVIDDEILGGQYRLLRQIGAGGIARVFEAEDLRNQRTVAIKLVSTNVGGETSRLRLEREAGIVARLRHPNICQVYDIGRTANGAPFLVLERLFGETLAERTRGVLQLPIRATLRLFSQLLLGLQAAHDARVIHRDLKPQNIFLTDYGAEEPTIKILDFGLAQDLSAATRITRPGSACGTLNYMAPEQLRVEPLDARADLFSVGVMLYEALAGRHPFAASSRAELMANILRGTTAPLRARRPDVPQALADLIAWSLGRTPAERPATAIQLHSELMNLASLPSLADDNEGPSSVTEPTWLAPTASPPA
jgi:serine/threonine-protein kinase